MDVIVYKIPGVATLTIGTKQDVGLKLRDYEKRFPGAKHLVRYSCSDDGTLWLGYNEKVKENGIEKEVPQSIHLESGITSKDPIVKRPVIFEQLNYFFDIEFEDIHGLEKDKMFVKHYLTEFTDNFNSRGRSMHGQFSFVNEPGQFRLEVHYKVASIERSFWFEFTVASTKMDVLKDYREILKAVERWDRSLVFSEKAKTLHEVQKAGKAEPDEAKRLVVYFEKSFEVYERALKRILHEPNDRMISSPYFHRADQIKRWSPSMAREFARYKNDTDRLRRHKFIDPVREMTFDTQENRFVKHTLKNLTVMLQAAALEFAKDEDYDKHFRKRLTDRVNRFKRYMRDPKFASVGRFVGEANSMVMQMRPGYSDIRVVWVLMNSLFTSDISLASARNPSVGLAKLSALYEFWCYLTVKEIMDGIMSEKFGITPIPLNPVDARKAVSSAIQKEDDEVIDPVVYSYQKNGAVIAEVAFQQSYGPNAKDDVFAGPFQQRPDIVVRLVDKAHVYTYLFDAKYRIENSSYTKNRDAAPRDALDQMHRYRDAILWRKNGNGAGADCEIKREVVGAYILFPADTEKNKPDEVPIYDYTEILKEQNIGAFPLLPGRTDLLKNHLEILVEKLDIDATTSAWLLKENQVIPQKGLYYTDVAEGALDESAFLDVTIEEKIFKEFVDTKYLCFPVKASCVTDQGKAAQHIKCLRVTFTGTSLAPVSVYVKYVAHYQIGHYINDGGKFHDGRSFPWASQYFNSPLEEYEVKLGGPAE